MKTGRLRAIKLNEVLEQMGALRTTVDPGLYEWHHPVQGGVLILVYTDAVIVAGESFAGVEAIKSGVSAVRSEGQGGGQRRYWHESHVQ